MFSICVKICRGIVTRDAGNKLFISREEERTFKMVSMDSMNNHTVLERDTA